MFHAANRAVRAAIGVCTIVVAVASIDAQKAPSPNEGSRLTPNYDLAAAWAPQKVSKLVFDTSVTSGGTTTV